MSFTMSRDLDLHSAMVYIYPTVSPIFRHRSQLNCFFIQAHFEDKQL